MSDFSLAIVDGTGPWNDVKYQTNMQYSFCRQLGNIPNAHYERGPSGEGFRIRERAERAVKSILVNRKDKAILAGYSRGGSIVILAAEMLKKENVIVDFLFLFDPVNRHLSGDTDVIPSNVIEVWAARRKIGAKEMDKYDHMLPWYQGGHNPIRNWFGTTAVDIESSGTVVNKQEFLGSHGALGGVGWPQVTEDPYCQRMVAQFMNRGLKKAGIPKKLIAHYPAVQGD